MKQAIKKKVFKIFLYSLFVLSLLFFIGAISYVWFFGLNKGEPLFGSQEKSNAVKTKIVLQDADDSDGDGLLNWQEDLYGTSKTLRDSDGDGMSDGAEVSMGRDPAYFGERNQGTLIQPQVDTYDEYVFETETQDQSTTSQSVNFGDAATSTEEIE